MEALERLVVGGDVSSLTPQQRVQYYYARCQAAGVDPRANPFAYLNLSNKLVLYAQKSCTDQLIANHHLTVEVRHSQTLEGEVYEVTARVTRADGTHVDDVGCVSLAGTRGEQRCNAIMKAVTKAKRRAVLSACGLGMLDETEVSSIQGAQRVDLQQVHEPVKVLPPPPQEANAWTERVTAWKRQIEALAIKGTREQLAALQAEIRKATEAAPKGQRLSKAQGDELRQAATAAEAIITQAENEGDDEDDDPPPEAAS